MRVDLLYQVSAEQIRKKKKPHQLEEDSWDKSGSVYLQNC